MNKGERVLIYTKEQGKTVNISIGWVAGVHPIHKTVTVQQNKGGLLRFFESGQSTTCNSKSFKKG
jgi:hypothetical protein